MLLSGSVAAVLRCDRFARQHSNSWTDKLIRTTLRPVVPRALVIRYLTRKSLLYLLTFFFAVTIDWAIPRLMPGNPIDGSSAGSRPTRPHRRSSTGTSRSRSGSTSRSGSSTSTSGAAPARGPRAEHRVRRLDRQRADLGGAPLHAGAARPGDRPQLHRRQPGRRDGRAPKSLDNTALPVAYILTATPYMWLALVLVYFLAFKSRALPRVGRLRLLAAAGLVVRVRAQLPQPLVPAVPDAVPRLVRRLGDRHAEPDHLRARVGVRNYLQALGAPNKLVRKYAYGNAVLPQMSGLALALGRSSAARS